MKYSYRLLNPNYIMFLDWIILGLQEDDLYFTINKISKEINGERKYYIESTEELKLISKIFYQSIIHIANTKINPSLFYIYNFLKKKI